MRQSSGDPLSAQIYSTRINHKNYRDIIALPSTGRLETSSRDPPFPAPRKGFFSDLRNEAPTELKMRIKKSEQNFRKREADPDVI